MLEFPFNDTAASAFLKGRVEPDDAPPGYQDVAELIRTARTPATADELAGEDHVVAAFAVAVRETQSVSKHTKVTERRPKMFSQLLSGKVAVAATVAILGGGTVAAAAGALPASVQATASADLSHIGVSVPHPNASAWMDQAASTLSHAVSQVKLPPTTTDAHQMCVDFANSTSGGGSTSASGGNSANSELNSAAAAQGETVQQYCASLGVPTQSSPPAPPTLPKPTVPPSNNGQPSDNPTTPPSGNQNPPSGNGSPNPWAPPTLPKVTVPNTPTLPSSVKGPSVSARVNVNASVSASAH